MKRNSNMEYILKNMKDDGNKVEWLMCIENYFGKKQAEEFSDYFINYHNILRKDDIRNLIQHHSLSVYTHSYQEQMAFISIYKPLNSENILIKNMQDGFKKAQKLYRKKNMDLSKLIKNMGYSYSTIWCNLKDKNKHDTYQKEFMFIVYSEQKPPEQFTNDIINLVKKYNVKSVLITDTLTDDTPKLKIISKIFDVATGKVIQEYEDTTIDVVELYLSGLADTRVLFELPYENNKTILSYDNNKPPEYYSKFKQEKVRQTKVKSFNMGILKQNLVHSFDKENYNN